MIEYGFLGLKLGSALRSPTDRTGRCVIAEISFRYRFTAGRLGHRTHGLKMGYPSAGRALDVGLDPYRVECRRISLAEWLVCIYHPQAELKLVQRTLTRDQLINPFVMNAVVARLRVEVDALSIFVDGKRVITAVGVGC
ncbi:hypothetical protein [Pseudomonas oryzihabitans]|uniref:hypothetical protein n=1 Tax=Pseudomonas oryzihabitans TaxID=47885 RepID=UPI00241C165E|nr:hypothetical protein [Pseudomonas oryzihabitans]